MEALTLPMQCDFCLSSLQYAIHTAQDKALGRHTYFVVHAPIGYAMRFPEIRETFEKAGLSILLVVNRAYKTEEWKVFVYGMDGEPIASVYSGGAG